MRLRVLNALNYPQVKFYSDEHNNLTSDKILILLVNWNFHGKKINKTTVNAIFLNDSENSIKY